jgi:hypothetical protein
MVFSGRELTLNFATALAATDEDEDDDEADGPVPFFELSPFSSTLSRAVVGMAI